MPPSALQPHDLSLQFAPSTNVSVPAVGGRRKTPSELRQEQLSRAVKSRSSQDGVVTALLSQGSTSDQKKTPRLVDTRVADVFAATKPHERPKFPFTKQKDDFNRIPPNGNKEDSGPFRKYAARKPGFVDPEKEDFMANDGRSSKSANVDRAVDATMYSKFLDVTQLASTARPQAQGSTVDMAEALKMMAPSVGKGFSTRTMGSRNIPLQDLLTPISFSPEPSKTPPLDLSLKLSVRFLSNDSLHWCHRRSPINEVEGMKLFVEQSSRDGKEDYDHKPEVLVERGIMNRYGAPFCQALHSWVHPPPQFLELYDIAWSTSRGDTKKTTMASLYRMWEDSFSSLYHMFLHKQCNLFYLCTQQFVVMFVRGKSSGRDENLCKAFWTRSTRGIRKILQEQGVEFSMPFCKSQADINSIEDLHELTEFEKLNPGRTRLVDAKTAIDNSSQSLLEFEAGNVHSLFDFLLNYRFLVNSGNPADFPVLYSPVPFSHASLFIPEVKSKQIQSVHDMGSREDSECNEARSADKSAINMSYSLELKGPPGAYITPWVISSVCMVLQKSQRVGFEASFVTGSMSEPLNVARSNLLIERDHQHVEKAGELPSHADPSEVSSCTPSVVKHLRYIDGFYQVTLAGLPECI